MSYINTGVNADGIIELMFYKGTTGKAITNMSNAIMNGKSSFTRAERELIATHVSRLNGCKFCSNAHGAALEAHLKDGGKTITCVSQDIDTAPISNKMKELLKIATKVQKSGHEVKPEDVTKAMDAGADDEAIHDTVLVASFFCMLNRYVEGLGTSATDDMEEYKAMGESMAKKKKFKYPPLFLRKFIVKMINKKAKKNLDKSK